MHAHGNFLKAEKGVLKVSLPLTLNTRILQVTTATSVWYPLRDLIYTDKQYDIFINKKRVGER